MSALIERCRFPAAGTAVTCAVSGGADSLALLLLAVEAGCRTTAIHVDHGLRAGSAAEADVVARAAAQVGAEFRAVQARVEDGPNLEARARAARYAALPDDVLTGHTADDQAETVLLNLLRGAGLDGLAGIRDRARRPLLDLRRHETHELCRSRGLEPVEDPTNASPDHRRNRVRHEVLPLLAAVADRDLVPILARQARLLADDADLLGELAAAIEPTDGAALAAAPLPLARRAVREWLREAADAERHPPDAAAVDRVLAVARHDRRAAEVAGGRRVARTAGRLRVERG